MNRNIEIKASITDLAALRARVEALAQVEPEVLHQEDTFFHTGAGRLKLRVSGDGKAELIYYERKDDRGPTASQYVRLAVDDPSPLKDQLAEVLGVRGIVRKEREIRQADHTIAVDILGKQDVILQPQIGEHTQILRVDGVVTVQISRTAGGRQRHAGLPRPAESTQICAPAVGP